MANLRNLNATPFEWNIEFDQFVKHHIDDHHFKALIDYHQLGAAAALAVPTNDHYLPLLYAAGMIDANEPVKHIFEGYHCASLSMRCFQAG